MKTNYNEQLQEFQKKISQKNQLKTKLRTLKSHHEDLDDKIHKLEEIMYAEEMKIHHLEHISFVSIFYTIVGKKREELEKAKENAHATKAKYDTTIQELNLVEKDIGCIDAQLCEIFKCEQQYETLLQEKCSVIKTSGTADAEHILQIEERIATQKHFKNEINKAISSGSHALDSANKILSSLNDAKTWGVVDMVGGNFLSDAAKYSHLDKAKKQLQQLQKEVRCFKTSLTDMTIHADMQIRVDEGLRFADFFFDNFFVDYMAFDNINQSESNIQSIKNQIQRALSKLHNMKAAADKAIKRLEAEKASVIVNAVL